MISFHPSELNYFSHFNMRYPVFLIGGKDLNFLAVSKKSGCFFYKLQNEVRVSRYMVRYLGTLLEHPLLSSQHNLPLQEAYISLTMALWSSKLWAQHIYYTCKLKTNLWSANFSKKTNGRIWFVCFFTLHGKQIKFVRSFFWRIYGSPICFLKLTDLYKVQANNLLKTVQSTKISLRCAIYWR